MGKKRIRLEMMEHLPGCQIVNVSRKVFEPAKVGAPLMHPVLKDKSLTPIHDRKEASRAIRETRLRTGYRDAKNTL